MKILKVSLWLGVAGIIFLSVSFVVTRNQIEKSLIEICDEAAEKYDCLPRKALILQLSDTNTDLQTMNSTIWAIGKMKMEVTLPKLEQMYAACDNEHYQYFKSKRELEKAIAYMRDGKLDLMSFDELHK